MVWSSRERSGVVDLEALPEDVSLFFYWQLTHVSRRKGSHLDNEQTLDWGQARGRGASRVAWA